ncbi:MAG: RDD family protein [Bacteroidales bacterium]|nr:RDD family protein [Bacteroidales bacterium]
MVMVENRIEEIGNASKHILLGLLTKPRIEREIAFVVDILFCSVLTFFPNTLGIVTAVAYFLLRDNPLLLGGQSFGKHIYGLRVCMSETGEKATWRTVFLRNLFSLIPILNIVDFFYFVRDGRRLVDVWMGSDVREVPKQHE